MHFKQPMNYQPWALQVVSNLVRVRSLVARHIARQDEARTNEFLYAAARGDTDRVLQVGLLHFAASRALALAIFAWETYHVVQLALCE